jgi:hypothetical protein
MLPRFTYTLEVTICQGPKWESEMIYGRAGASGFSRQSERFKR